MKTRLQTRHRRQSAIPAAFAESTLATAIIAEERKRQDKAKQLRKVARLIQRGEL